LIRSSLLNLWDIAKKEFKNPVEAWASIQKDDSKSFQYKSNRGKGGFVRISWDDINELIVSANIYTIKTYGPDRVFGFRLFLLCLWFRMLVQIFIFTGGVCLSFMIGIVIYQLPTQGRTN
jgi:nitrate reductase alpha subunit